MVKSHKYYIFYSKMLVDLENVIVIVICVYYILSYFFQPKWKEYRNMFLDYVTDYRISEIETKIKTLDNYINELKNNVDIEKIKEDPVVPVNSEHVEYDIISEVTDVSEDSEDSDDLEIS